MIIPLVAATSRVAVRDVRKALILEEGMKPVPISVSAEDSEVLDSRKLTAEEVARVYGVPPPLVGIWDHTSALSDGRSRPGADIACGSFR